MTTETLTLEVQQPPRPAPAPTRNPDIGILYDRQRDGPVGFKDLVVVYADGTSKRFNKKQSIKKEVVTEDGNEFKPVRALSFRGRPARDFKHRAAGTRRGAERKRLPGRKVQCSQPGLFDN